jgi:hypothetical protein
MAADCQACLVGVPRIKTPAGKPDNPIGACTMCGSLTCGEHGHRDPKGKFLCIQCDVNLQAGSAGWKSWRIAIASGAVSQPSGTRTPTAAVGLTPSSPFQAAAALADLVAEDSVAMVASFAEWAARRPFYAQLIQLIEPDLDWIVSRLDQAAEQASKQALGRTRPGFGGVDPAITATDFATFWHQLDRNGRYLLAAAMVLALVMNLPLSSLAPPLQSIAQIAQIRLRDNFPQPGHEIPYEQERYR